MPVYNADRYVGIAVESILDQTFRDFEFLIVDDGSTDTSLAVLNRYAACDSRVRIVSRPNTGLAVALNEMLNVARGKYVARMDADDISEPHRIERQVEFMEAHSHTLALGTGYWLIDESGRRLRSFRPPTENDAIQANHLVGHTSICHPTAMIRAEALRTIGGYDPQMVPAEDLDIFLRLGELGELGNLPDALFSYRLHALSVSELAGMKQRAKARDSCEAAWRRRGIVGHFEATEPWRPGDDRSSRYEFTLQRGWWAFNSGERGISAHYGWKAVALAPWRSGGWRLLACALLKRQRASRD